MYYEIARNSKNSFENCSERCVRASYTVSKKAFERNTSSKRKNCWQRARWTITMKTGPITIPAKGTNVKHSPFSLLYLWIPRLTMPPSFSLPIRKCQTADTVPAKKPSTDLLSANCGVLFRGYMSLSRHCVSHNYHLFTRCPFRPHHLSRIKQPEAGSGRNCPGAAAVRLWVSALVLTCAKTPWPLFPSWMGGRDQLAFCRQ